MLKIIKIKKNKKIKKYSNCVATVGAVGNVASRLTYRRLIKKLNNTKNPKERKKL